jgi:hypothetical protein
MLPNSKITHLLSQERLAALGEVAANSAELEWMLGFVVMWCLGLNGTQTTRAIIGDAMLHRRIALLEVVGSENLSDKALKDDFKVIIERMKALSGNRNTVIHGTWGAKGAHVSFEDSLDMEFGTKAPDSIIADNPKNARKYSAEELRKLADDLESVRIDLWHFSKEHWWKKWTDEIFLKHGFNALTGLRKD